MGLLGRQFGLEREKEDLLLLTLSILTFTISLFSGYMENGIGRLIALPAFGIEFHLISTPLWLFRYRLLTLYAAAFPQDLESRYLVNWSVLVDCVWYDNSFCNV